jgi:hypothetical protein
VVRPEHQREVRETRRAEAERAIDQHLPRRVGDVVLAPDHVGDLHQRVVHDDGEVVGGTAVGAHEDRIADDVGAERHLAADQILKRHVEVLRHAEADDGALARLHPAPCLVGGQAAAGPVILGRPSGREVAAAIRLQLLRRAEAVVGMTRGEQLVGVGRIEMQALRLAVGPARAADVRPFVPVQAEPAEVFENALLGLLRRTLGVGVLDAEDERAVVPAREQPVEERGARVADVELTGGAGGEAYSHDGGRNKLIAWAAMASPRPTASTPSLVFPFTLTHAGSIPIAPAMRERISSIRSLIFGRSRITVTSTLPIS